MGKSVLARLLRPLTWNVANVDGPEDLELGIDETQRRRDCDTGTFWFAVQCRSDGSDLPTHRRYELRLVPTADEQGLAPGGWSPVGEYLRHLADSAASASASSRRSAASIEKSHYSTPGGFRPRLHPLLR